MKLIAIRNVILDSTVYGKALEKDDERQRNYSYVCLELAENGILIPFSISAIEDELSEAPIEYLRKELLKLYKNLPIVKLTVEQTALELTKRYSEKIDNITKEDSLIVAIASVNELDAIISWNRRHLANEQTQKTVKKINDQNGFKTPLITPEDLMTKGSYTPDSRGVLYALE